MARVLSAQERRRGTQLSLGLALCALIVVGVLARVGRHRALGSEAAAPGALSFRQDGARGGAELAAGTPAPAERASAGRVSAAEPRKARPRAVPESAEARVRVWVQDPESNGEPRAELLLTFQEHYPARTEHVAPAPELLRLVEHRGEIELAAGPWVVRAYDRPGGSLWLEGAREGLVEHVLLELAPGEERELRLRVVRRTLLQGRVCSFADDGPIAGAEVFSPHTGRAEAAFSDALGRFQLRDTPISERACTLVALAQGWAPALRKARPGEHPELRLVPEKIVRATVRASVHPSAIQVSLLGEGLEALRAMGRIHELDLAGELRLAGLPSTQRQLLVLEAPGCARWARTLEAHAGELDLGTIELEAEARLLGELLFVGPSPAGAGEWTVSLAPLELELSERERRGLLGGKVHRKVRDSDGFELGGLHPGRWLLEVTNGKREAHHELLELPSGTTRRIIVLR